jgi:tetratricopeptide (TPR) repeat protein
MGLLAIGGLLVYHRMFMPTAPTLAAHHLALPTPEMMRDVPEIASAPSERAAPAKQVTELGAVAAEARAPARVQEQEAASDTPSSVVPAEEPTPADAEAPEAAFEAAPGAQLVSQRSTSPVVTDADADGYRTLVAQARKQGYRRAAESSYLQALSIQPQGAEALGGLAMLYLNQGKDKPARDRAQQAVAVDPSNSEAWIVLGAAQANLGNGEAARAAYGACARLSAGKYVAECRRMLH